MLQISNVSNTKIVNLPGKAVLVTPKSTDGFDLADLPVLKRVITKLFIKVWFYDN